MAKVQKEQDFSLLQKSPDRDVLFEKMREALILGMLHDDKTEVRKREVRSRGNGSWWIRIALAFALLVAGLALIVNKEQILSRFGYESVPSLPAPRAALGKDDQALYWTYALYDIDKLRKRFGVQGYYAIDEFKARNSLSDLVPDVSPSVLGEISAYTSVAFRSLSPSNLSYQKTHN
jgi:hypothetical protein